MPNFYAKSDENDNFTQTVYEHCLCVGEIAKQLSEFYSYDKYDKNLIGFICSLHDIGKITPGFQLKIGNKDIKYKHNDSKYYETYTDYHAGASAIYISNNSLLKNKNIENIIDRHHGYSSNKYKKFRNIYYQIYMNDNQNNEYENARNNLVNDLKNYFKVNDIIKIELIDTEVISGILMISDWVASSKLISFKISDINILSNIVSKILIEIGFKKLNIIKNLSFKDIFNFEPYSVQTKILSNINDYGVYLIEDQTGRGKTETALMIAYNFLNNNKSNGLCFCLPTQVTSNAMYKRVENFLNKIIKDKNFNGKLIHSSSLLALDEMKEELNLIEDEKTFFNFKHTRILNPIITGTMDQLLMAVLNFKFNCVRATALYKKIIIIDEVHGYDRYMQILSSELVNFCKINKCIIIMLSATCPKYIKENFFGNQKFLEEYPLLSFIKNDAKFVQVPLADENLFHKTFNLSISYDSIKSFNNAIDECKNGKNILIIENSVKRAQEDYEFIKKSNIECYLIHSKFTMHDRLEKEIKILDMFGKNANKSNIGRIVISTQVMEQSLDVDFDKLYTRICLPESFGQRCGRIGRRRCGIFDIVVLSDCTINDYIIDDKKWFINQDLYEYSGLIYPTPYLFNFLRYLENKSKISYPNDYREQMKVTYETKPLINSSEYKKWINEYERIDKQIKEDQKLGNELIRIPGTTAKNVEAYTRLITEDTIDIILVQNIIGNEIILLSGDKIPINFKTHTLHQNNLLNKNKIAIRIDYLKDIDYCNKSQLIAKVSEKLLIYDGISSFKEINLKYNKNLGLIF